MTTKCTPITFLASLDIWVKRDDLYSWAGANGGKTRGCKAVIDNYYETKPNKFFEKHMPLTGLITSGSRHSPQIGIVAKIASHLKLKCRCHTSYGEPGIGIRIAKRLGAEIIQHRPGYNSVIIQRAIKDSTDCGPGWLNIPFGMESQKCIEATSLQFKGIPGKVKRIVIVVGSGLSLAGILHGMTHEKRLIPVLGIIVGAKPHWRLDRYAPSWWRKMVKLETSEIPYGKKLEAILDDIQLHSTYEAKCLPYLQRGDLFWIVGGPDNE